MSVTRYVRLVCDGCGTALNTERFDSIRAIRTAAAQVGWTFSVSRSRDLCPSCSDVPTASPVDQLMAPYLRPRS